MTNKYKPVSVVGKATYGDDEFEADLSATDERDALAGGHLELVPRTYRVLSDNFTAAEQGETFEGVFPVENEAALMAGGHIVRVDPEPDASTDNTETTEDGAEASAPKPKKRV